MAVNMNIQQQLGIFTDTGTPPPTSKDTWITGLANIIADLGESQHQLLEKLKKLED